MSGVLKWVLGVRSPTAIDLFCGAGGLSLGLRDAGFTVLVGADNDEAAVETHTATVGGLGYVGDLSDPEGFLRRVCLALAASQEQDLACRREGLGELVPVSGLSCS